MDLPVCDRSCRKYNKINIFRHFIRLLVKNVTKRNKLIKFETSWHEPVEDSAAEFAHFCTKTAS